MLSLTANTPLRVLHDIAASDHHAGVPRLMALNGHAGNQALPEPACRGLRARLGFIAADVVRNDLACPECIVGTSEARNGLHAGDVETSAILGCRFSPGPHGFGNEVRLGPPALATGEPMSWPWCRRDAAGLNDGRPEPQ
jgi:hypothetical protein